MIVVRSSVVVCFVGFCIASTLEVQAQPNQGRRGSEMVTRIMRFDTNRDGKVSKAEMPPPILRIFSTFDTNRDGAIQRDEAAKLAERMTRGPGGRSPSPLAGRRPTQEPAVDDVAADTATHREVAPLSPKFGDLKALVLRKDGNLLVGDGKAGKIVIVSPSGEQVGSIDPGLHPEVMELDSDGRIYCGGDGKLAMLSADGKLIKTVSLPDDAGDEAAPQRGGYHPPSLSGLAIADESVYVTFGSGWSVRSKAQMYRFDRQLENPQLLGEGFRGCCQHCDIEFRDGVLYMAENSAFRVVQFDPQGQQLGKWGSKSRDDLKLFNGCCNPMNICFGTDGALYTAESGVGRVKRYSTDGKFLGLVGYLDVERFLRGSGHASTCCHIPIAVTPDGDRVYVSDTNEDIIRVLQRK